MKLTKSLAIAVAAGTMLVGAGAGATAATAAPAPRDREAAIARRIAKLDCAKADQVKTKINERAAHATTRGTNQIARLNEAKSKAQAAGHEEVAARIQKRIDRLSERLAKIPAFVEKLDQKIDQKCPAAG